MRNHIKKVIVLAVLVIVVGSVIVAGAKDADPQRDWKKMCEKANGLIWDAVCEILGRVEDLEGDLGRLDETVDKEIGILETADADLRATDTVLTGRVDTLNETVDKKIPLLETADAELWEAYADLLTRVEKLEPPT